MLFNPKVLAIINLLVQILLLAAMLVATRLAKKKQFIRHCNIIRVAVVLQLLSTFLLMLPSMLIYLKNAGQAAFQTEMIVHHSLGVLAVLLWVYINLAMKGRVRVVWKLAMFMRTTFIIWVLSFLLGLHIYFQLYIS